VLLCRRLLKEKQAMNRLKNKRNELNVNEAAETKNTLANNKA
jgi:hypothetical protein